MEKQRTAEGADKPNFQFQERVVLMSMICLMLMTGITFDMDILLVENLPVPRIYPFYRQCQRLLPALATLLVPLLSELTGRKPTLITLTAASIISSVLHAFPDQETCVVAAYVLKGLVKGGVFSTTFLTISEFCSPKHRFAYLIANMAAFNVGHELTSFLRIVEVLTVGNLFVVQSIQLALGVVCLGVFCVGPESPYWLARRGRLEESRLALMWLRGEGSEAELSSVLHQHHRRGPQRLFWLPLLAGISAISVHLFSKRLLDILRASIYDFTNNYKTYAGDLVFAIVFLPIITAVSYKVNHRSLFLAVSMIPIALSYGVAVWLYFEPDNESYRQIFTYFVYSCSAVLRSGPYLFGIVLSAEVIPPKYNTFVVCVCFMYFYLTNILYYIFDGILGFPMGFAILTTSISLFWVIVFYFSSPETKDKILLYIQKLYTPKQIY